MDSKQFTGLVHKIYVQRCLLRGIYYRKNKPKCMVIDINAIINILRNVEEYRENNHVL